MADGGRGQPLLPWPNRLADGRYEFGSRQLQLSIDEIERHCAIHGLVRWLNWRVAHQASNAVRMELMIHPRPGYPFTLDLSIDYLLTDDGLTVRTTGTNRGSQALPFGAGQHPYLTAGTPFVDTASLQIAADTRMELDAQRRLPTGKMLPVDGSEFDFRALRPIGPLVVDECFSHLHRDANGRAHVTLADPRVSRSVVLWMDRHYNYIQVFSGDTLAPERRRRGLAVEPMTCPPNAFRTQTDLIVLEPGESISLEWGIGVASV
jgi:aldose 1-epimerase